MNQPYLIDSTDSNDFDLSIVVPAYNEDQRLPKMMEETVEVREYSLFFYYSSIILKSFLLVSREEN